MRHELYISFALRGRNLVLRVDEPSAARVAAHNAGKGAKYTKTRRPVVLAYYEEYATRSEAMRREAAIKKLTKKEKEAMAALGRTELPVDDET